MARVERQPEGGRDGRADTLMVQPHHKQPINVAEHLVKIDGDAHRQRIPENHVDRVARLGQLLMHISQFQQLDARLIHLDLLLIRLDARVAFDGRDQVPGTVLRAARREVVQQILVEHPEPLADLMHIQRDPLVLQTVHEQWQRIDGPHQQLAHIVRVIVVHKHRGQAKHMPHNPHKRSERILRLVLFVVDLDLGLVLDGVVDAIQLLEEVDLEVDLVDGLANDHTHYTLHGSHRKDIVVYGKLLLRPIDVLLVEVHGHTEAGEVCE